MGPLSTLSVIISKRFVFRRILIIVSIIPFNPVSVSSFSFINRRDRSSSANGKLRSTTDVVRVLYFFFLFLKVCVFFFVNSILT